MRTAIDYIRLSFHVLDGGCIPGKPTWGSHVFILSPSLFLSLSPCLSLSHTMATPMFLTSGFEVSVNDSACVKVGQTGHQL
jgi:hypothetical protein